MSDQEAPAPDPVEEVRAPRLSELRHLAAIEDSGAEQYAAHLGADGVVDALRSPAPSGSQRDDAPGFLLVVGRPVVGFAHVLHLDGHAHLEQVSVLPSHQRRGLGSLLVRAAMREAERDGFRALSLCTYRDLPFNGPFYAGLGFVEVAPDEQLPFQRRLREHEVDLGLDGSGTRVVMSVALAPERPRPDGVRDERPPADPFAVPPVQPAQPGPPGEPRPDVTGE